MQVTPDLVCETLADLESTIRARYSRRLSRMNQRFDLDDLYQTVCLKAVTGAAACRAESLDQLRHWVLTIAKCACETAVTTHLGAGKRSLRSEQVAIGVATEQSRDGYQPAADDREVRESMVVREECGHVLGILDRLPQLQQAAVRLRYIEGAEYQQIAEQLGVTLGAARSLVTKGLVNARAEASQPSLF